MKDLLLKIKNLKKYYKSSKSEIKALDDVSLDIYKGEIVGLLGVNGAGKTTLSSILATLHPPTGGDILVNGDSIYKDINSFRRTIGFCPQSANLIDELTIRQNLMFAGRYFGLSEDLIEKRLDEFTTKFKLGEYLDESPDILSGGYRQRVMLARALMHGPKLLILDEPTVGLDPNVRRSLWKTVSELREDGVTIILTTHYLDEAEFLSDRICMLDHGKIMLIDTPEGLRTSYQKKNLEDVFIHLVEGEEA